MKLLSKYFLVAALSLGSGLSSKADGLLFDFGADATTTIGGQGGPATTWNNVNSIGMDDFGFLEGLLTTDGTPSFLSLQMVARFNGPNESGTTSSILYPPTATRDSLYGNTELWQGLENIFPVFKIIGLDPSATYTFTFYASRTGVADNRETRYTVTGAAEAIAHLDAANNVTNTVTVPSVSPDPANEITIALTPGDNNNNGNHFTYINVLQIVASTGERYLIDFGAPGSPTDIVEAPASAFWNNITPAIGATDTGVLDSIVTTNGTPITLTLQMVSRFNGQNSNGTTASTNFPATATQDSLFGNTEAFGGASNILPVFKLTGLDPNFSYSFTFFGSRTGVSDNRETRYAVTGANSGEALLNTANNTNTTVSVPNIRPSEAGEISIALSPGPNNNNANHFTYLGVMKVDFAPVRTPRILIDFGGANTTDEADDVNNYWNNVTTAVGSSDMGALNNLVRTDNSASGIGLQMVSRFNGANENGTQLGTLSGAPYVIEATRDSLFGNTELFSGLENVTPIFKLTGLNTSLSYDLSFYASRMGVGDNRETRYTVTGASESTADLNAGNNELEVAVVNDVTPDANGEITIALTPGPNNDNGNHFTYLGVLQIDWEGPAGGPAPTISGVDFENNTFSFTIDGTSGVSYLVQRTTDFAIWEDLQTVTLTGESQQVDIPATAATGFYRLVQQ
jgi:hypothetical protein